MFQAPDGDFYGTTRYGGTTGTTGPGNVFKITRRGTLTSLYTFCSQGGSECTDGRYPGSLVQGTDGNFYGTTVDGGANSSSTCPYGCGTLFQITAAGKLTTLYSFCSQTNCADGAGPTGLTQATNGTFYGTTVFGGTSGCTDGCGTVFSLSMGLGPFAQTVPISAGVGKKVIILGNNLTGATGVSFNSTVANFTVTSNTEIKASVPKGATTGFVTVTLPSGTLQSDVVFRVNR